MLLNPTLTSGHRNGSIAGTTHKGWALVNHLSVRSCFLDLSCVDNSRLGCKLSGGWSIVTLRCTTLASLGATSTTSGGRCLNTLFGSRSGNYIGLVACRCLLFLTSSPNYKGGRIMLGNIFGLFLSLVRCYDIIIIFANAFTSRVNCSLHGLSYIFNHSLTL